MVWYAGRGNTANPVAYLKSVLLYENGQGRPANPLEARPRYTPRRNAESPRSLAKLRAFSMPKA